jgi:hypothetical protein
LNWQFLHWVWNFPRETRPKILEKITPYRTGKNIIILKTPVEVKQFVQKLANM